MTPRAEGVARLLRRMVARALWRSRGAFLAAALVSAFASALFVAAASSSLDLEGSCEATYERLRFNHFLLLLSGGPDASVDRVRHVPGVEAAEGRHVGRVSVPVPASAAPDQARLAQGEVHGLPVGRRSAVDDVAIDEGRYLSGARGELLMETRFARANGFRVGHRVRLLSNGANHDFEIVGLASSPEFVWVSRNRTDPRPTAASHAVLFAADGDVRPLEWGEACAEIHVRVADGRQLSEVMEATARSVSMWRREPPLRRTGQASYAALRINRVALSVLAATFPPAFALLGCVTLAAALRVLLLSQRRATGVLIALGCDARALASPWLLAAALLGGVSGALGGLVGIPLGFALTRFYTDVLGLPFVVTQVHPAPLALAVTVLALVSTAACALTLASEGEQRPAALLSSSEAITPRGRTFGAARRHNPLQALRLTRGRLPLLGLLRRPARSALAALGLGFAVLQLTLVGSLLASQQAILHTFFGEVNRWTFYVTLHDWTAPANLPAFDSWPGVLRAEMALRLLARVEVGARNATVPLLGLPPHATLMRQVSEDGHPFDMTPDSGIYLPPAVFEALGARTGEMARVSVASDSGPPLPALLLPVAPPVADPIALAARLPLRAARGLLSAATGAPSQAVNLVLIRAEPEAVGTVRRRLDHCDRVDQVIDLDQERGQAERLLALMDAYGFVTVIFAATLAVVLVASASVIGLLERRRELALLETLGLGRAALQRLLVSETLVAWAVTLVPGGVLGLAAARFALGVYRNAVVHLSLVVSPLALATAALLSLLLALAAVRPCLRLLGGQNLRETLDAP